MKHATIFALLFLTACAPSQPPPMPEPLSDDVVSEWNGNGITCETWEDCPQVPGTGWQNCTSAGVCVVVECQRNAYCDARQEGWLCGEDGEGDSRTCHSPDGELCCVLFDDPECINPQPCGSDT